MANHKSSEKRAKQTIVRRARNKIKLSKMRTLTKKIKKAIEDKNKTEALKLLPELQSALGKMAKTNVIKKQQVARRTSRIATQIKKLS
ncbi:MAG: 30S ribosomal protein S20 [Bacteriovoracaceae bacterium]|nr:30S ribosomal protein S20 [Bacteriovoracaceae bacterium]